jgi:uncharacterized protein
MKPVALVTGASSGIGEVFARKLAARGYDLILVARREDRLRELGKALAAQTQVLRADLATEEGVAATERVIAESPSLELLVNNAGFGTVGLFWDADLAGQIRMQEVHILATMRLTHAALKGMVARRRGGVINVSSIGAYAQSPQNVGYCASKAWINSFTEGLDMELRSIKSPVKVQALCPGFTVTEFHQTLGIDTKGIPAFLWTKAEDVVETSLRGFDQGKVIAVPGWQYKIGAVLMKHLPHAIKKRMGRPGRDRA